MEVIRRLRNILAANERKLVLIVLALAVVTGMVVAESLLSDSKPTLVQRCSLV